MWILTKCTHRFSDYEESLILYWMTLVIATASQLSPQIIWPSQQFHIYHHRLYDHHHSVISITTGCHESRDIYCKRLYDYRHSFISITTGYMTITTVSYLSPQVIWPSPQCHIYHHRLYDHHHSFISITTGCMTITTVSYLSPQVVWPSPQFHIYHHRLYDHHHSVTSITTGYMTITTVSHLSPQVIWPSQQFHIYHHRLYDHHHSVIPITTGCRESRDIYCNLITLMTLRRLLNVASLATWVTMQGQKDMTVIRTDEMESP